MSQLVGLLQTAILIRRIVEIDQVIGINDLFNITVTQQFWIRIFIIDI